MGRRRRARSPETHNSYQREWARRNPDRRRQYHLKHAYDLTPEGWQAALVAQSGRCGLCGDPLEGKVDTDHDHQTGKFRGLLHHRCNIALSHVEDEQFRTKALAYLATHKD